MSTNGNKETKVNVIDSSDYQVQYSNFIEEMQGFTHSLINNVHSQGIITEIAASQLKTYFANPDMYQTELANLIEYFYISNPEVHMLYELVESLPSLNYKIDSFESNDETDANHLLLRKVLTKLKHKRLSRDLIKQAAAKGNVIGMWIGTKKEPYAYIFDSLRHVEVIGRDIRNNWIIYLDMGWFDELNEFERQLQFNNLSPFVTEDNYKDYQSDPEKYRFVQLPAERCFNVKTGTLSRNQMKGTAWATSGMYDIAHKKKLKDVEQSIANKVINAIAVLTIGSDKHEQYSNLNLNPKLKRKVHEGVKAALDTNEQKGVTVITIPDFAKMEFPDVSTDGLEGKKFDHINSDIRASFGMSGALMNGEGTNFSSAKLNMDMVYKRIAVLLEDIEQEVYQPLFNWILPNKYKDLFNLSYEKNAPLTHKEKIDVLGKLSDKGWSIKYLVDMIGDIEWEAYLNQTIHETENMNLQDRIKPYQTSHTLPSNGNEGSGRPEIDNPDNENTAKSKTSDGNNVPD